MPTVIKQLLCDGQNSPCKRYLRQLYKEPLTKQEFSYIYDEQKQMIGLKSNYKVKIINAKVRKNYQVNYYQILEFKVQLTQRLLAD